MPLEPAPADRRDSALPAALGKYLPFARLGSGGMAEIFLSVARGPVGFNKLAVVKRLRNPDDPVHVAMFLDEARLAARLNHPNVVHIYEIGQAHGRYFIAMEYLEGQSLDALMTRLASRSEGLNEALVAYVAAQALRGLHHAHELRDFDGLALGVVHRDVSPHNLYVTYGGEVKLLDFGIAKAATNVSRTETGVLKGKVRYMCPEQVADRPIDRRADLYSFGVVLWELLARRPLFQGDAAAVLARIVNENVVSARAVRPDASPDLDRIALKALRRDPDERYATADEMRVALEEVLRARGYRALDTDLAGLMTHVFMQTRDEIRGRIKAFLEKVPPAGADEGGLPPSAPPGELPVLIERSGAHTPPGTSGVTVTGVGPRPTRRWTGLILVVAASIASVFALGRLVRPIEPARVTTGAAAAVTPPGAVASPLDRPAVPQPGGPSDPAPAPTPSDLAPAPAASNLAPAPAASKLTPAPAPAPRPHRPASTPPAKGPPAPRKRIKIRVLDDSN
jgi:serine/threonine-protein kinase